MQNIPAADQMQSVVSMQNIPKPDQIQSNSNQK